MPVAAPDRSGLRYMRQITLLTLMLFVGAGLLVVIGPLPGMSVPPAVAGAVVGAALLAAVVSTRFMAASVAGADRPVLTRGTAVAFAAAAVAAASVPVLIATAAPDDPQWWWTVPLAVLVGAAVVGSGLPRLATAAAGTVVAAATGVAAAAVAGRPVLPDVTVAVLLTVFSAGSVAAQVWFWDVAAQLDRARQVEGEAAVAEERLRFAAELHDIQGHSLQVIALKSELAARLVGTDPDRAVTQMREVETLARQALRDTREVAHGYRTVTLATEIANATRVLAAAGVRCTTRRDDDLPALDPAAERLLGLVVREATTNVIRHSRAGRAEVALTRHDGGVRLRVGNDAPIPPGSVGHGGADGSVGHGGADGSAEPPAGRGGGLAGLAERFTATGGRLEWRREADRFTVTATVTASP